MSRVLACLLIVAAAAGCSTPPDSEHQQADRALNAARQADAAAYAPNELHAAEAALKKYDEAVAQRDYRRALSDALEARNQADTAVKQAGIRKAEVRGRAETLLADLDALSKAASAWLAGTTSPRPSIAAAERLRTALRTAPPLLQEARSALEKEDYQSVVQALTPAVDAFRRELPASETQTGRRRR